MNINLTEDIRLAFGAIRSNMLRTILTLLIIAFGITSLVGTLTAVDAIKASINSSFSRMGANSVDIRKWKIRGDSNKDKIVKNITWENVEQFKKRFSFPAKISASTLASFASTLKTSKDKTDPNKRTMGGDENYLDVAGYDIALGRNFSNKEIEEGRQVVIVGSNIVKDLFKKNSLAIGKSIVVDNTKCQIIGVLEKNGSASVFNADDIVIIPVTLLREKYQSNNRSYTITIAVENSKDLDMAAEEATGLMRAIRKIEFGKENDFEIAGSDKIASSLIDNIKYFTIAATIIGLITLFGAAIGLMNIMLVSVAERTREIGVSKAIGASKGAIRRQYIVESIVIGQLGGILGIIFGILIGFAVSMVLKGPFIIPWIWIFGGIAFCLLVSLVAGIYPAIKASNLEPIESLRYE